MRQWRTAPTGYWLLATGCWLLRTAHIDACLRTYSDENTSRSVFVWRRGAAAFTRMYFDSTSRAHLVHNHNHNHNQNAFSSLVSRQFARKRVPVQTAPTFSTLAQYVLTVYRRRDAYVPG